jgi:hypothetical protein
VTPVLDPTWESPYAASAAERAANAAATRSFLLAQQRPFFFAGALVVVACIVAAVLVTPLAAIAAVAVLLGVAFAAQRRLGAGESKGAALGSVMLEHFTPGGSPTDRKRLVTVLDRLAATFGVNDVSAFIVADEGYNAAIVPNGTSIALFVTSAVMSDFELIEIEGIVAHLLARHRLGLLPRTAAASALALRDDQRRQLAGEGNAYRADEVAAAAIRYPLGLAGALRKCARQVVGPNSFFSSPLYNEWRCSFFDVASDRRDNDLSDLDDVELRALALEEW